MLGVYAALLALDVEVRVVMAGLGLVVAAFVGLLAWRSSLRQGGVFGAR
jgi:hypothetical protein